MMAGTGLEWMQRQTKTIPITIVFAGYNDHLHSRSLLSRLKVPTTAENAAWPAIKYILESMGEFMDMLKEGGFQKKNANASVCLIPGICTPPGWIEIRVCKDSAPLRREK